MQRSTPHRPCARFSEEPVLLVTFYEDNDQPFLYEFLVFADCETAINFSFSVSGSQVPDQE